MTKTITEGNGTAPATATGVKPKPSKKALVTPRRAPVAPAKTKLAKKTIPRKKAPKSRTKTAVADSKLARKGSKTAKILDLLKRPSGATIKDLMKASGWQAQSVRGFLSGTVGKKMGLTLTSTKSEEGERTYSVEG